ncbi:MAG TPA: hypothetical protein VIK78_19660 [Ruminiclostridium sp.]
MTAKIKDLKKLEDDIALKGFSECQFSKKIKRCRQFMHGVLKNGTTSPCAAKAISDALGVATTEYFEFV